MLYPLDEARKATESPPCSDSPLAPTLTPNGRMFTVHFDLKGMPKHKDIEAFGSMLSRVPEVRALGTERIRWGGIRPTLFHRCIQAFSSARERKQKNRWDVIRKMFRFQNCQERVQCTNTSSSSSTTRGSGDAPRQSEGSSQVTPYIEEKEPHFRRSATLPFEISFGAQKGPPRRLKLPWHFQKSKEPVLNNIHLG